MYLVLDLFSIRSLRPHKETGIDSLHRIVTLLTNIVDAANRALNVLDLKLAVFLDGGRDPTDRLEDTDLLSQRCDVECHVRKKIFLGGEIGRCG